MFHWLAANSPGGLPDALREAMPLVLLGAGALTGLLFCFWGYRLFRFLLALWGFLCGFGLGYPLFHDSFGPAGAAAAGAIMGLAGAFIFYLVYPPLVFALGAGFLGGLALAVVRALQAGETLAWVAGAAAGLLGGVLALVVQRCVVIAGTANLGAGLVAFAVYCLASGRQSAPQIRDGLVTLPQQAFAGNPPLVAFLAVWGALLLAGIIVQLAWTGRKGYLDLTGDGRAPPPEEG